MNYKKLISIGLVTVVITSFSICSFAVKATTVSVKKQVKTAIVTKVNVTKGQNKLVQKKLNELGYPCGIVDGVVGPKTRAVIKKFQKDKGLKVDGRINSLTKKALGL